MAPRRAALASLLIALAAALAAAEGGAPPTGTASSAPNGTAAGRAVVLHLFWGRGCPNCESERAFLGQLKERHRSLVVREHEVRQDSANHALFERVAGEDDPQLYVPFTLVGRERVLGFGGPAGPRIEAEVARCAAVGCPDPVPEAPDEEPSATPTPPPPQPAAAPVALFALLGLGLAVVLLWQRRGKGPEGRAARGLRPTSVAPSRARRAAPSPPERPS
jgi:hypothetical protein